MDKIKNINEVMRLLKEAVKDFESPIAADMGKKTRSPYMVLVSCLLSLRTMDKVTGPVSNRLFEVADTPEKIAKMPLKRLQELIRPVNYYITKSKRLKDISRTLIKDYGGKVPDSFEELLELKGVGRKTANIVMTYGFFRNGYIAVDTHVNRIPNRLGWIKTKTPEQSEQQLKKVLPKEHWHEFNDIIVTFGQNICKPIGPKCGICPVNGYCKYYKEFVNVSENLNRSERFRFS